MIWMGRKNILVEVDSGWSARSARNSVWLSSRGVGQNVRPRDKRSISCFVRVTWDRLTMVECSRGGDLRDLRGL